MQGSVGLVNPSGGHLLGVLQAVQGVSGPLRVGGWPCSSVSVLVYRSA